MSRTTAHRPALYWFGFPHLCVARHDHRDGICDLVPLAEWVLLLRADAPAAWRRRCRWEIDSTRTPPLCGCGLCTDRDGRRARRRTERHAVNTRLRRGIYD